MPHAPCAAEFLHVKPGKGSAFVRSKLKNFKTGNTTERTFRAGESVAIADIERLDTQFTYSEGETVRVLSHQSLRRAAISYSLP